MTTAKPKLLTADDLLRRHGKGVRGSWSGEESGHGLRTGSCLPFRRTDAP